MKLTRPIFLIGGFLLYLVGAVSALQDGHPLSIGRFILGQLLVSSIQLMTHYSNEYYDQAGDAINTARTWFSGGSGTLIRGEVTPGATRRASWVCAGMALLLLAACAIHTPMMMLLGGLAFLAAWFYSAPPLRLVSTGWGEFTASLVVALLVPLVGYAMQTGGVIRPALLMTCAPLVFIHLAMLLAFEIPDYPADWDSGKRTFAVRFGIGQTIHLHNGALILAFCVILGLSLIRWPGAQAVWIVLPLAAWQLFYIHHSLTPEKQHFSFLTFGAIALFALTTTLWLVGLALRWIHI